MRKVELNEAMETMSVSSFVLGSNAPLTIQGKFFGRGDEVKAAELGADVVATEPGVVLRKGASVEIVPWAALLLVRMAPAAKALKAAKVAAGQLPEVEET